jgi:hypothetical protein
LIARRWEIAIGWIGLTALLTSAAIARLPTVVPTADVAVQIARAILISIYGEEAIRREEPLTAELRGDMWEVMGTLHCPAESICNGGVVEISIVRADGRVIRIEHGL